MALTAAEIQARIDAIRKTLGRRGERFQDRGIDYSTDDEKLRAIAALEDTLSSLSGDTTVRTSYAAFSKG